MTSFTTSKRNGNQAPLTKAQSDNFIAELTSPNSLYSTYEDIKTKQDQDFLIYESFLRSKETRGARLRGVILVHETGIPFGFFNVINARGEPVN